MVVVFSKLQAGLRCPDFVEETHETVVNHESNGYIKTDTTETWNGSFVEATTTESKQWDTFSLKKYIPQIILSTFKNHIMIKL